MKPINSVRMRWLWMACLLCGLATLSLFAQHGLPFFVNYTAKEY